MHTWKRIALALAATAVAAAPLLANAAETIKIGVTQPLTGPVAASGNYVVQGARIAESFLNEAGGILGMQVELIVEDNKSNPKEAVATAEKLIVRDEVSALMGAWSSTYTPNISSY